MIPGTCCRLVPWVLNIIVRWKSLMPALSPILALSLYEFQRIPTSLLIISAVALAVVLVLWAVCEVPLTYNIRNLTVRWKTTIMTALAFTLVLGLMTVMLAFVKGMQRLTENSGQPGNVIVLSEGATDEGFSNLGFSDVGDLENQPGVTSHDDQKQIRKMCSRETYLVVNQPIADATPGGPQRRFVQMRCVDDPEISGLVHGVTLLPNGRWFSASGVQEVPGEPESAIEVVIGEGVARELAKGRSDEVLKTAKNPERLEIGDVFHIANRSWLVVGVMQSSGSTFDSEVWGKRSVIGPKFGKASYTSLVMRAKDASEARKLKDLFKKYEKASVNPILETDYFESLSQINKQFEFGILFVTVFIAIGGVFGVMNTMFAAISQRTKDIGVLQLLGFGKIHIMISFLLESLVIAFIGGLIGCALGSFADGLTATSVVGSGQGQGGGKTVVLKLTVDAISLVYSILLTLGMGVLGGFLPAFSAIRLKPLDALR